MTGSDAGTSLKSMLIALANPTKKRRTSWTSSASAPTTPKATSSASSPGRPAPDPDERTHTGTTQPGARHHLRLRRDPRRQRALQRGADGIADWTKKVSDSGYAAQQAAAKNDNLRGDLENLSGSFESMMIKLGEGGQPLRKPRPDHRHARGRIRAIARPRPTDHRPLHGARRRHRRASPRDGTVEFKQQPAVKESRHGSRPRPAAYLHELATVYGRHANRGGVLNPEPSAGGFRQHRQSHLRRHDRIENHGQRRHRPAPEAMGALP